jgi:hypothetical protein
MENKEESNCIVCNGIKKPWEFYCDSCLEKQTIKIIRIQKKKRTNN